MDKKTLVYTKNNCGGCTLTKQFLDEHKIGYTIVNISEQPERRDDVIALGFQSLPVVVIEGELPFSGFNPAKLADIFNI